MRLRKIDSSLLTLLVSLPVCLSPCLRRLRQQQQPPRDMPIIDCSALLLALFDCLFPVAVVAKPSRHAQPCGCSLSLSLPEHHEMVVLMMICCCFCCLPNDFTAGCCCSIDLPSSSISSISDRRLPINACRRAACHCLFPSPSNRLITASVKIKAG